MSAENEEIANEEIAHLVYKFNNGSINPDELRTLVAWYNSHDDQYVTIPTKRDEMPEQVKSRILAGLLSKVSATEQEQVKKSFPIYRWMAAAAVLLLISFAVWMMRPADKQPEQKAVVIENIGPGGNKATLTLADNRTIELSDAQAGIVAGNEITYANGAPVEDITSGEASTGMLSLRTPRGGTYKIVLSDGTQVWLNAASSIRYPSQFAANERMVELEGEAYFQVKAIQQKNGERLPFKVISKNQEVEVLGTQFNMNAYPEQATVKTTLVEGKVAVSDRKNKLNLMPGEQAITASGKTTMKAVDVDNYTAWRDGKFSFDGKNFEETMAEIGRWYDLDIVYQNGVPATELVGDAYRNEKISLVLRLLDVAEIDYQLDVSRRKLTIKGKKM